MKYISIFIVCLMISACSSRITLTADTAKGQDLDVTIRTSQSGTPTVD